jgi:hypothetical protein
MLLKGAGEPLPDWRIGLLLLVIGLLLFLLDYIDPIDPKH